MMLYSLLIIFCATQASQAQIPKVLATIPPPNALHVPTSSKISATFDVAMDVFSINDTTVFIHGSQTGPRKGILSYDSENKKVTFVPDYNFNPGEAVRVILTNKIRTADGVALENGFCWEFTIRSERRSLEYAPAVNYAAGIFPSCLYAGDLDQDADIDLAAAEDIAPGNLFLYLNFGNANFATRKSFSGAYHPTCMIGQDLDGDGDIDLATSNHEVENSGFVIVWQNKGFSIFGDPKYYGYANNFGNSWIDSRDFDGDGDYDLAVSSGVANKISLLFNNGDATFGTPALYSVGNSPQCLTSADLDLDGDMDIAVANWKSDNVSILKNAGGQFALTMPQAVGYSPYGIASADIDGDGNADLATANSQSNNVSVLLNKGDGSFAAAINYPVPSDPRRIIAADFDGDGDMDIATTHYGSNIVHLLCNNGTGEFTVGNSLSVGKNPKAIQVADLDGDGDLDFITANTDIAGTVSVLLNNGVGSEPRITEIKDVGNDYGRQVRIKWQGSVYDAFASDISVSFYSVWRRVDDVMSQANLRQESEKRPSTTLRFQNEEKYLRKDRGDRQQLWFNNALWDFIASISAERCELYAFVAPTLADSTGNGIHWSVFSVSAHTQDPDVFFNSAPDSGYSVDNLFTAVQEIEKEMLPKEFALSQNYPNPCNPLTHISYQVPETVWITLKIFDPIGREVKTLVNEKKAPGYYDVVWDGTNAAGANVASGVYLYRLGAGRLAKTEKLLLIR